MSAPNTDVKEEEKKHKPALLGIKAVLIYAAILLVGWLVWTMMYAEPPQGADTQIDGRTGEEVQAD